MLLAKPCDVNDRGPHLVGSIVLVPIMTAAVSVRSSGSRLMSEATIGGHVAAFGVHSHSTRMSVRSGAAATTSTLKRTSSSAVWAGSRNVRVPSGLKPIVGTKTGCDASAG